MKGKCRRIKGKGRRMKGKLKIRKGRAMVGGWSGRGKLRIAHYGSIFGKINGQIRVSMVVWDSGRSFADPGCLPLEAG
jgi:hypothetical protein